MRNILIASLVVIGLALPAQAEDTAEAKGLSGEVAVPAYVWKEADGTIRVTGLADVPEAKKPPAEKKHPYIKVAKFAAQVALYVYIIFR